MCSKKPINHSTTRMTIKVQMRFASPAMLSFFPRLVPVEPDSIARVAGTINTS